MTDPAPTLDPTLAKLAETVSEAAAHLATSTIKGANRERAGAIVSGLADAPRGTRNCDLMMALGVAVAVQAHCVSADLGVSQSTAISIIATALGLLAKNVHAVEVPTDPKQIN